MGTTGSDGKPTEETAVAANKEMVFVDEIGLRQVLTKSKMAPGKFYFDYVNKRIYLAENPTGNAIEATTIHERAFTFPSSAQTASGSLIRGLGFRNYANTAVVSFVASVTLENNTSAWNALIGFHGGTGSTNTTLRGNVFSYNGRSGATMGSTPNVNTLVEGNVFSYNNKEGFATYWAASGMKVTEIDDVTFRGNLFDNNYSTALWMDAAVERATVMNNIVRDNQSSGIFFEVSRGITIAGNVCHGNAVGVYISGSSDARIYNNTMVGNTTNFRVKDTSRRNTNAAEVARGVDFETREVVFKNNILVNAKGNSTVVGQDPCESQSMIQALDYNLYWRSRSSVGSDLIDWNPTGCADSKHKKYVLLSDFKTTTGLEQKGVGVDNRSVNQLFADSAKNDYRLLPTSPAVNAGEVLPTAVAEALGWAVGARVSLGAKQELAPNPTTVAVGTYQLLAKHSGQALDVYYSGTENGVNVQQWPANGSQAQQWLIQPTTNGYYTLTARCSGKVLEVSNSSTANGALIWQWTSNGSDAQQWRITPTANGYYTLEAKVSGKLLDVSGISLAVGANVIQSQANGGDNQQWLLTPVSSPVTRLTSGLAETTHSGLRLYPNPVSSRQSLTLHYRAARAGQAIFRLADLRGRIRGEKSMAVQAGENTLELAVGLPAGMYLLQAEVAGSQPLFRKVIVR